MADVEEVWQPFAARFAALALGELDRRRRPPQPAAARALTMTPTGQAGAPRPVRLRRGRRPGAAPPTCSARTGSGCGGRTPRSPPASGAAELLAALSRAADPDLALRQLHRLVEAERRARRPVAAGGADRRVDRSVRLLDALHDDPGLRRRLVAVLGASSALGDHLVANPDQWPVLATAPDGLAPTADGRLDLAAAARLDPSTQPVAVLRQAYRLALLRIAAADLTGGRDLEQTMAALSALADATLAAAYEIAVEPSCRRGRRAPGWPWWRWASAAAASSTTSPTSTSSSSPPPTTTSPPPPRSPPG